MVSGEVLGDIGGQELELPGELLGALIHHRVMKKDGYQAPDGAFW